MSFYKAKFEGMCGYEKCPIEGRRITVGADIAWNPKSKPTVYFHESCMQAVKLSKRGARRTSVPATVPAAFPVPADLGGKDGAAAPMVTVKANGDGLSKMAELLAPFMRINAELDRAEFKTLMDAHSAEFIGAMKTWQEKLEAEVAAKVAGAPRRIEVVRDDGNVKKLDSVHERFEFLLHVISKRDHAYLWGPPGSGKSTAAHQVADALGLSWGYISLNPQTPDSRILGFIDANGVYRPTVFREKYQHGGVMCIDELDNSSPSLCVTINSGLENGHMAFPDGMIERHKDFVLVATGNTTGRGANAMFPERRPFDAAFQERFTYLEWDYDWKLEMAVALSINPKATAWVEWIREVREFCRKNHPRIIVSPRASFKGAKYLLDDKFDVSEIAEMVIWKGNDPDTVSSITRQFKLPVRG